MLELYQKLKNNPVIYITRDIERALGLPLDTEGYFIISNSTDFAKGLAAKQTNILLINAERPLNTLELLSRDETSGFIERINKPNILVFKNNRLIEKICKKRKWNLLNPSPELSAKVEEKIFQVEWLGALAKYLPPHQIQLCREVKWRNKPFILQFNTAHTGLGTIFIDAKEQLAEIQNKFPKRPARVAKFIHGPIFTNNNIVAPDKILIGNINYQITGLSPFTDNPFATIGNDWKLPRGSLSQKQIEQYHKIANDVGAKLRADGWKGLFGIDIILEEKTGRLYLLEINARQPASAPYESQLQRSAISNKQSTCPPTGGSSKQIRQNDQLPNYPITIFEAHLAALLNLDLSSYELIKIKAGAQIIQRITAFRHTMSNERINNIKHKGFNVIPYERNIAPGAELLRMQTAGSIMKSHNILNKTASRLTL
ncbi:MAG: ATP-grasp domain-containing protein [Patescibacteria group bacterium]